ncbi:30S ribosomal protein S8 [Candidatus Parcubacteria bacterium]|nr:30S ribosomal protein S8 [Candidatus Parcubacteria bacterium]
MVSDRVGDFIIRLKNAGAIGQSVVFVPHSNHLEEIAKKLKELGFVADVSIAKKEPKTLEVTLAYDESGEHKIKGVDRVSKPGRRLYAPVRQAHSVKSGLGALILSTPKGILSDKEARRMRAGGETLFKVW